MGTLDAYIGCMLSATQLLHVSLLDVQLRAVLKCCLDLQVEFLRLARPQLALAAPQQLIAPLASCERLAKCHQKIALTFFCHPWQAHDACAIIRLGSTVNHLCCKLHASEIELLIGQGGASRQ